MADKKIRALEDDVARKIRRIGHVPGPSIDRDQPWNEAARAKPWTPVLDPRPPKAI